MKKDFNNFRFEGLNHRDLSNKYFTMDRVNGDETKIVVKIADSHVIETRYGYAIILDRTHVVFVKEWQVSDNYFGIELLLTKEYFTPKAWGEHDDFDDNEEALTWEHWLETAKLQDNVFGEDGEKLNRVRWEK